MQAVVIIGGEAPHYRYVSQWIQTAPIIIAADSGYDWAIKNNVAVDIVIGDLDSVSHIPNKKDLEIIRYPADKDWTDTELALQEARTRGARLVVMIGGGGGRLDHLIGLLYLFHRDDGVPNVWALPNEFVYLVNETTEWNTQPGTRISVFPVGKEATQMGSTGLQWPLDNVNWRVGDIGLSNVATDSRVSIEILQGKAIVVVSNRDNFYAAR